MKNDIRHVLKGNQKKYLKKLNEGEFSRVYIISIVSVSKHLLQPCLKKESFRKYRLLSKDKLLWTLEKKLCH